MKKILSLLTASVLVGTSGANLLNTKLFINNASGSKSSLTVQQNNNHTMTRYDSLNLVNEKSLNNAINNTTKEIKNNCKDISLSINGKNINYKNELLKIFSNKDNLLNTNNQYEQYLNQSNNCKKNKSGISFPMNYNGVYFPWWGFGDYFYWYMSSDVYQKFYKAFGWGQAITQASITAFLTYSGIASTFLPLLNVMLLTLPASFYIDTALGKYDDGNGIYLGISILPSPTIFEIGNQDKYISKINSFEVDYRFLAADYITACIDEQGVNFLLNYYNQNNNNNFADNIISPYLKQLTAIDNTGWGGSITNQDYTDWSHSFIQNDPFWTNNVYHSHLKDFIFYNPNFRSIDIGTKRGYNTTVMEDPYDPIHHHYDDTWEIWKNS